MEEALLNAATTGVVVAAGCLASAAVCWWRTRRLVERVAELEAGLKVVNRTVDYHGFAVGCWRTLVAGGELTDEQRAVLGSRKLARDHLAGKG